MLRAIVAGMMELRGQLARGADGMRVEFEDLAIPHDCGRCMCARAAGYVFGASALGGPWVPTSSWVHALLVQTTELRLTLDWQG